MTFSQDWGMPPALMGNHMAIPWHSHLPTTVRPCSRSSKWKRFHCWRDWPQSWNMCLKQCHISSTDMTGNGKFIPPMKIGLGDGAYIMRLWRIVSTTMIFDDRSWGLRPTRPVDAPLHRLIGDHRWKKMQKRRCNLGFPEKALNDWGNDLAKKRQDEYKWRLSIDGDASLEITEIRVLKI